jgi:hypothetical protein
VNQFSTIITLQVDYLFTHLLFHPHTRDTNVSLTPTNHQLNIYDGSGVTTNAVGNITVTPLPLGGGGVGSDGTMRDRLSRSISPSRSVCLFLFIDRFTPIVGPDHGADRVGNISSTVGAVVSRNIAVDSIVDFNYDSRTSPVLVDSDLTGVADYRSHWHSSLFSEEQIELPEQCGQSVIR